MSEYGFWNLAQQDPDHLALVDAGRRRAGRAGELLARANRLVHGLRALGLGTGDCVAIVLPNGARDDRALPRRRAGRLVPDADQPPPDRVRDRLHRAGLRREGVRRRTSASPRPARGAADEIGFPQRGALRGRRRCPASAPTRSSPTGQPTTLPDRARRRPGDELHVGHDRPAEGRAPPARRRSTPTPSRSMFAMFLGMFGIQPRGRQRPPRAARRSTTRPCSCSRRARCTSGTPSC